MRLDVHQHLWSEGLCEALARRRGEGPRIVRRDGALELELPGEAPFALGSAPDDPAHRAAALADLDADGAIVALSSALGVETLAPDEARDVIAAWDEDADGLPAGLAAWGSVALGDATPDDVDVLLDRGRVGLCLPATALQTPADLERAGPLLERLARRDAPLFVHPGPPPPGTWLAPLTAYVASLSSAWCVWAVHGRSAHPDLRVLFAALAGLGPLHAERLAARGHPDAARSALADRLTYLETSSYGPLAIDAIARTVGSEMLVHGSDWPYAEPVLPAPALRRALLIDNPASLLHAHGDRILV